jgi:peptide/nickel transport system substrate-binding protein
MMSQTTTRRPGWRLNVLVAVGLMMASCQAATPTPPTKPTSVAGPSSGATGLESSASPQRGGVLRQWTSTEAVTLLPHEQTSVTTQSVAGKVYNQIVTNKSREEIVPDLAKSWTISQDGTEYLFEFEDGVKFHNGTAFTSADAKFTIESMMNPPEGVGSFFKAYLASTVRQVETPTPLSLRVVLNKPSAMFLRVLATQYLSIVSKDFVEKSGWKALQERPMGTGPFKIDVIRPGISYSLVRNPDYFKEGLPYLDRIEITIIEDRTTAIGALATGQIDLMATDVTAPETELLKQLAPQVITFKGDRGTGNRVVFNTHKPPFDDLRVRQAFSLALNQEDARQVAFAGYLTIGGPLPPDSFWALPADELSKRPEYGGMSKAERISKAKQLLTEAGHPNGFDLEWSTRSTGQNGAWNEYVASTLPDIGIKVHSIPKDRTAFTADYQSAAFDFFTQPWTFAVNDPTAIFASCCILNGQWNVFAYDNPKFNQLWEEQAGIADPEKRREVAWEMQRILLDDLPDAWLGWWGDGSAYRPVVHGFTGLGPDGLSYWNRFEDVWLDSKTP